MYIYTYTYIIAVTDSCNFNKVLNVWSEYNRNVEKL